MLSHASKGHNPITMMSYNCIIILHDDVINVMLLSDDVTYHFVLCSVVSKYLLLGLSVLCVYCKNNTSIV